jgi:hypothetical protein
MAFSFILTNVHVRSAWLCSNRLTFWAEDLGMEATGESEQSGKWLVWAPNSAWQNRPVPNELRCHALRITVCPFSGAAGGSSYDAGRGLLGLAEPILSAERTSHVGV